MPRFRPWGSTLPLFCLPLLLAGCHSALVDATVENRSGAPISLVEIDYPSASFGTQSLTDGADFHYRFKIQGSGPLKLTYTDQAHREHTDTGPDLNEGSEGLLLIVIGPTQPRWQTTFRQH